MQDTWTFSASDIALLLRSTTLEAASGSPFRRLGSEPAGTPLPLQVPPTLREALARLATPQVALAISTWPDQGRPARWFYRLADDLRFVECNEFEPGRFEIVWPRQPREIADIPEAAVYPEQPVASDGTSFQMDAPAFAALLGIADIQREDALLAALHRLPAPRPRFDAAAVHGCYWRSARGADRSWLARRAAMFYPIEFVPGLEDIAAGLGRLAEENWLDTEGPLYLSTGRLVRLCALWSAAEAACAITTRRGVPHREGGLVWDRHHLVVLKGSRHLWRLDLTSAPDGGFHVMARSATTADLCDWLELAIPGAGASGVSAREAPKQEARGPGPAPPAAPRLCEGCGAPLRERARFCTKCGKTARRQEEGILE